MTRSPPAPCGSLADADPTPCPPRELPRWVVGALGFFTLILLWEIAALTLFSDGKAVPTPTAVIPQWHEDGWSIYWANVTTTVREATRGWFWGNLIAIILAVVFIQVPFLERSLMKLAVAAYCLPVVAIGPILAILFHGDSPKIILAALLGLLRHPHLDAGRARVGRRHLARRRPRLRRGRASPSCARCACRPACRRCSPGCGWRRRPRCWAPSSVSTSAARAGSAST